MLITFVIFAKGQQNNDVFVADEIYVRLKTSTGRSSVIKRSSSVNIKREIPGIQQVIENSSNGISEAANPFFDSKNDELRNVYRLKLQNGQNLEELLKELKHRPEVEVAERIPVRKIIAVPSDTQWGSQWSLQKIKASEAWDIASPVKEVKVAVVDNAIQTTHPDLVANMLTGYDVSDNDSNPNPPNANFSHGTHVAGIVGAVTNNSLGIASAGNNRVKIIPVKATRNTSDNRFIDDGFEGIAWAVSAGADIISLSWGGPGFSQIEQDIIDDAYAQGVLIIAAAGNENSDEKQYPAAYDHVISVASLDSDDKRSSFSSYGDWVDLAAPGRGILSTIPFDTYASFSGTSMATPLTSACAGFLLACFPSLTPDSLEIILKRTSDAIETPNPDFSGLLGSGRINLLKAIACRNVDFFSSQPTLTPGNFFCPGEIIQASIPVKSVESFVWQLNGQPLGTASSIQVSQEGELILQRTLGNCVLDSDPLKLVHNQTRSPQPSVQSLISAYCDTENQVMTATAQNCTFYGPQTFEYTGPVVGFDGFEKSGDYPSVQVSGLAGLIDSVLVSVTWQKKDGGRAYQCDIPDQGLRPFNEELSFSIQTPDGKVIPLINEGTYAPGTTTSGIVTTVFSAHGVAITNGSLPASGTFRAAGNLSQLQGVVSQGKWTLIANDNYLIDPLCVSGFSVTIKSLEATGPPEISWKNQAGDHLNTGSNFAVSGLQPGIYSYYVSQKCEGACESEQVQARAVVKNVPDLFAFRQAEVVLSAEQFQIIQDAISIEYYASSGTYFGRGINSQGNPFNFKISDRLPFESPVVTCKSENYLIFAGGCSGKVHWNNGYQGNGVPLFGVDFPYELKATCVKDWGNCMPMADIRFNFTHPIHDLSLRGIVDEFTSSHIIGNTIESTQILLENVSLDYSAPRSILLSPGFETSLSTVFQAEIGDCSSN